MLDNQVWIESSSFLPVADHGMIRVGFFSTLSVGSKERFFNCPNTLEALLIIPTSEPCSVAELALESSYPPLAAAEQSSNKANDGDFETIFLG